MGAPILADAPTKSCDGAKPILTDGGECREPRASDCVGATPDFVNSRCEAACPSGQTRNSGVCEAQPTTKRCADGLDVALDAVCMKDCNGGRIPEAEIYPPPTKRCADGLEIALDAVCMKDCNSGRIPESDICPPPTKRCADGLEIAVGAVCMKDCNGSRIPESEICPPPTKRCADGVEVALDAVCMKDCNGGRIPEADVCPLPPPVPPTQPALTEEQRANWGYAAVGADYAHAKGYEGQGVTLYTDLSDMIRHFEITAALLNLPSPPIPERQYDHELGVYGIIAAERNGRGMVGIAPKAKILIADVPLHSEPAVYRELFLRHRPQIQNYGFAIDASELERYKILHRSGQDFIFVNSRPNGPPDASFPGTLTATEQRNFLSVVNLHRAGVIVQGSSHCGDTKDWCVAAPGSNTYVPGMESITRSTTGFRAFYGTAAATPHVSGALAVMKSAAQEIAMTVHRRIMLSTAVDLGEKGIDRIYGHGRVNLTAAIDMIEARKTPPMDGLFRSFSPSELGDMLPSEFAHLGDKIGDAEIAVKLADNFYYNAPLSKLLRPTAKAKTPLGDIGAEMTAPIIAASSSGFAAAGDGENNFALRWNGLGENTALMAEYAQSESESGIWEKSASGKILLRRNLFGGLSAFGEYERKRLQSDIGGGGFLAGTDNAQADGWLAGMEWAADERGKSRFRFWAKERMRLSGGDLIMRYPHYDGDLRVKEKRVPLREKGERIWSAGYASAMGVGGEWTAAAAYNSGTGEKKLSARWEWELR